MREIKKAQPWMRALLAGFVFVGGVSPGILAWKLLGATAVLFIASQLIFKGLRFLLPKMAVHLFVILTWTTLAYAAYTFWQILPYWILSLLILNEEDFFKIPDSTSNLFKERFSLSVIKFAWFLITTSLLLFIKESSSAFFFTQTLWIGAFSLLWLLEDPQAILQLPALRSNLFKKLGREILWIFSLGLALTYAAQLLFERYSFLHQNDIRILFLLPLTYLFCLAARQKSKQFIVIYGLSLLIFQSHQDFSSLWITCSSELFIMVLAGWGMLFRLKFSKVPQWISGLSVFFVLFLGLLVAAQTMFEAFPLAALTESSVTFDFLSLLV